MPKALLRSDWNSYLRQEGIAARESVKRIGSAVDRKNKLLDHMPYVTLFCKHRQDAFVRIPKVRTKGLVAKTAEKRRLGHRDIREASLGKVQCRRRQCPHGGIYIGRICHREIESNERRLRPI